MSLPTRLAGFVRSRPVLTMLLVALVLRLAWMVNARPEPVSDYLAYRMAALNLLDEGFFGVDGSSAVFLPGYPLFLAVLSLVSRSTVWLSLVMVVLSTSLCWVTHRLAVAVGLSRRASVAAAWLVAVGPPFVIYSPILGTEHLFAPLLLAAFVVALRVGGEVSWRVAALGFLLGVAGLVRGEALFYVPVVIALLVMTTSRGRRLAAVGLLGAGLVLPLTPWMARNALVVGSGPSLSTVGGMNFYFGHNPDGYGWTTDVPWTIGDDVEANRLGWELGFEYIADDPGSVVRSVFEGTRRQYGAFTDAMKWNASRPVGDGLDFEAVPLRLFTPARTAIIAFTALFLSMGAASALLWRRWTVEMRIVVGGVVLTNFLGHVVLFFGDPRFRYTTDAFLVLPVAVVIVALWDLGRSGATPADPQES